MTTTDKLSEAELEALLDYDLHDAKGELCRTSDFEDQSWGMSIPACEIIDTADVVKAMARELLAHRRAEAAAWNDAIEAAVRVTLDRQGRRAMGDGHGNSCYDIGVSDAANAIRALRRADRPEGEA